jgi:hypothetical protein
MMKKIIIKTAFLQHFLGGQLTHLILHVLMQNVGRAWLDNYSQGTNGILIG